MNANLRFYRLFCDKDQANLMLSIFPYAAEFLDIWIQRDYPVAKCTNEAVSLIPDFTKKQEAFLDSLCRNFEDDPIGTWYAEKVDECRQGEST